MGTNRIKAWTVEKAESAVKATFFIRADPNADTPTKLAYKEIKAAISESATPIGHTTLSRALGSLTRKKELEKEGVRKGIRYSLTERPRRDLVAVAASADRMAIESAAQKVGAVADPEKGWAFYGVPDSMNSRLRPRLRREATRLQERVDRIVQGELDRFERRLVSLARGRLTERELREALRGLDHAFEQADGFRLLASSSAWTVGFLEKVTPGALGTIVGSWERRLGGTPRSQLRELLRAAGVQEDRLEEVVTTTLAEEEHHQAAARRLFEALPTRARARAAREFADLVMLSASWCAVVR